MPSCGLLTQVGQTGPNITRFGSVVFLIRSGENKRRYEPASVTVGPPQDRVLLVKIGRGAADVPAPQRDCDSRSPLLTGVEFARAVRREKWSSICRRPPGVRPQRARTAPPLRNYEFAADDPRSVSVKTLRMQLSANDVEGMAALYEPHAVLHIGGGQMKRQLADSLDKAREIFDAEIKRRLRIRLTIRQRARVLQRWPQT